MTASRLLRLLILFALTLMPLRMAGVAPAMAADHQPQAAATGHCADMPAPADRNDPPRIDCMTACAALPASSLELVPAMPETSAMGAVPLPFMPGIAAGADPPPPRTA